MRLVVAGALAGLVVVAAPAAWAQDHGDEPAAQDEPGHDAHGAPGHDAATGGHGHHVGPVQMISHEEGIISLGAMLLNFAILAGLLWYFGRKPLGQFLKARHIAIRDALADAQATRAEAEARFKEYSSRLDHLDRELARLRDEMKTVAQSERDRILAEAEERGARLGREAEFLLSQELKQVRQDLERELATATVAAAEDVLRKATTEQDQVRLAESYLDVLGKQSKETSA